MRKLSTAQAARLIANQNAVLKDQGHILTWAQEVGPDYRPGPGQFTTGPAIALGYNPSAPKEAHDDQSVATITGRVRLPAGTAVTSEDRIRVTHVGGLALPTPLDFAIYGPPRVRPTVIICDLEKITDGST